MFAVPEKAYDEVAARVERFCDNQGDELRVTAATRDTHTLRDRVEHRLGNASVSRLCLGVEIVDPEAWRRASSCWAGGGGDACYLDLVMLLADAYRARGAAP